MVTPPPSTSTRREAALGERGADRGRGDPAVGGRQRDHLDARRAAARSQAWITSRRAPSAAQHPGVVGQPAARVDHHARRARAVRPAARSAAGRRRARCARRPRRRRPAPGSGAGGGGPSGPETSAASPESGGDAAVERLADLGEEVGRVAAVARPAARRAPRRRAPRPTSAARGRAGRPARQGEQRRPDLVGHLGALHRSTPPSGPRSRPCAFEMTLASGGRP